MFGLEHRFLWDVDTVKAWGQLGRPHEILVLSRHDFEQRRLSRTVGSQHTNLGTGIKRKVDPLQNFVFAVELPQVLHRENILFAHGLRLLLSLFRARGLGRNLASLKL